MLSNTHNLHDIGCMFVQAHENLCSLVWHVLEVCVCVRAQTQLISAPFAHEIL